MSSTLSDTETWPCLPLEAWSDTCATLHMWTQIVGKIRLTQSPWINHSWHVTLYVTARGLTTSPIPYGSRTFQIDFDFIGHELTIRSSDGGVGGFSLHAQSVAAFYRQLQNEMAKLDLQVNIHLKPNEVPSPIRFDRDESHCAYDPVYANRFWRVLVQADRLFKQFRARFVGKCSPVHFFWGAPDLAVTRFSGRRAPEHPGGVPNLPDRVAREAYSHEVSSCGFWPGGGAIAYPAFYSYAYPEPAGLPRFRSSRAPHFTVRIYVNSFCPMMWSARPSHRMIWCSTFCRRPMRQQRIWRTGIGSLWNEHHRRNQDWQSHIVALQNATLSRCGPAYATFSQVWQQNY
jgi:Family of unknown function (DUF5996)